MHSRKKVEFFILITFAKIRKGFVKTHAVFGCASFRKWFFVGLTLTTGKAELKIFDLGNVFKTWECCSRQQACINLICQDPIDAGEAQLSL